MTKEYIASPVTDQETRKITFVVVILPGDRLELYIDAKVENAPNRSGHPSFSGFFPSNLAYITTKAECTICGHIHEPT